MGAVWLAQDERLHEQVALKFLPLEIRSDATALDELRRETARSHKLTHVNIVRIHDLHEEDGGLAFIAMEYVDGRGRPDYALGATLYELLTSKPPFYTGDLTRQILNELPEPVSERLAA
jgi:serine/threonine protein kinase